MKIPQILLAAALVAVLGISASVVAAPVGSVESSRATAAMQKVDSFLGEKAVMAQMRSLGITHEQVTARLAKLSDAQVEQLAAQVDLLKAGGMIQDGHPNPVGPLPKNPEHPIGCFFEQLRTLVIDFFKTVFCWRE